MRSPRRRFLWMLPGAAAAVALLASTGPAPALQDAAREIFSRHVTVQAPKGDFVNELIRFMPAEGKDWKEAAAPSEGVKLKVPASAVIDTARKDSRVLAVVMGDPNDKPKTQLRIDVFPAAEGDPTAVDLDYAEEYAADYSERAFKGKFDVVDSGLIRLNKRPPLACVGGLYSTFDAPAYRLQLCSVSKTRQVFITFDCPEAVRERYLPTLAKMILTLDLSDPKK